MHAALSELSLLLADESATGHLAAALAPWINESKGAAMIAQVARQFEGNGLADAAAAARDDGNFFG